ncbi:MAG: c-type cytochrome, partial [Acidobacteriota bacterium]|nr:c-type cytochrome [Acidobacteriota bacterium]
MRSQNIGRNIRLALVAAFACLFAASWSLKSSAQQPAGGAGQQRQPGPDVPAEQAFKNIQVLKGMPSDQLGATMDFFSTSLGVNCGFCHARNAAGTGLDFASDAKDEKKTARAMIAMQMDLNAHHLEAFDGERISCYTCHQGRAGAPHFPRLPLAPPQDRPAGGGPGG